MARIPDSSRNCPPVVVWLVGNNEVDEPGWMKGSQSILPYFILNKLRDRVQNSNNAVFYYKQY